MSERPHHTSHLIQVIGLLVTVAAAALSVTVPEVRRFLRLDAPAERSPETYSGSPLQSTADTTWDPLYVQPATMSADTFSQVVTEPVEVESIVETVTVETTTVTP